MKVDLRQTDEQVAEVVKDRLSRYGKVVSIKLRRNQTPLAMVEMARREDALELAAQEGGTVIGSVATIRLESTEIRRAR